MACLIVEHDPDLLDVLCFLLRREGHDVVTARDGRTALQHFATKEPEIIILDAETPAVSGWDALQEMRKASAASIIVLTASASENELVRALELGADYCLAKPFSPRHLLARVRALLHRATIVESTPRSSWQTLHAGDFRLDPQWRLVVRGAERVKLTSIEFKLLYELVVHEGQVMTHQRLTDRIWGYEAVDDASLLKGHVRNIRKKIEPEPAQPRYLQTVVGVGYTFISKPALEQVPVAVSA
jgi:two-component system response regulator RegX3